MRQFLFPEQDYVIKSATDIALEFHKEGTDVIQREGNRHKILCFDDLGAETNKKHYGSDFNTMAEILLKRYKLQVNHGIITHATTNLNADELCDLYGNRVRSRLRKMFNLISFPKETVDKRK
ncbi:MAG: ATPase, partial [Brumimicrobium sp.]